MDAYQDFALVYDRFMDNVPYDAWADRICFLLAKYGCPRGPVLDLGCGTGAMTRRLFQRGFSVTGVDLSERMLEIARAADPDISYFAQDMRSLCPEEPAEAVVSVCDCVNYLLTEEELYSMFLSVRDSLTGPGLLLFDFNTEYKYREVIGDRTIAESREDCAFIWENFYDEESRINEYDLTLFAMEEDGRFARSLETHYQRGWRTEEITSIAQAAGFEVLLLEDGEAELCEELAAASAMPEEGVPVTPRTERVRILLKKRSMTDSAEEEVQ